jgi:hypothetical protein
MKTRTDLPLVALLAIVLAVPMLYSGCTEEAKARMATASENRRRAESQRVLKERASEYWEYVRWQNWSQAAIYLQEADDQKRYLDLNTRSDTKHAAMDDVTVAYVFVDPGTFESGEVRVNWNEVAATAGAVADRQSTQQWYKANGRWWVDPLETLLESKEADPTAKAEEPDAPAATDDTLDSEGAEATPTASSEAAPQ